nr:cobalamin biosynthesis protein [Anoxybacter fermentans]
MLLYTCIAARCLDKESCKVMNELEKNNLSMARQYLSYLVGRETTELPEKAPDSP